MYRGDTVHGDVDDDGQRACARGDRCIEAEAGWEDGHRVFYPAMGYRAFCDSCRGFVLRCLEQFPAYYTELGDRIGDKATGHGPKVSGSRTAPLPLNLTVDSLRVDMVNLVASWAARVHVVARLAPIDTDRSLEDRVRYGAPLIANVDGPFTRMCETLGSHLDALLALGPEPMTRFIPIEEADELGGDMWVLRHHHAGYAETVPELSGADAGLEVIRLNARCRWLLGYTGKDEKIAGCCFACEQLDVLVRPDGAAGLADYAECSACGTKYFGAEYQLLMRDAYERELAGQRERRRAS
jgi:hypothetical protein